MDHRLNTLMQDTSLRQAFGTRVKQLRKEHGWPQKQLAAQLDIRFQLLNKYEGGLHIPPAETLVKLADILHTTVDFLLTGDAQQQHANVDDTLLRRIQGLERCDEADKQTVINVIDALVTKQRVTSALVPAEAK